MAGAAPIGVLALQGGYDAHGALLETLGHTVRAVRTPADLDGLQGLVFPGGESSTMLKLIGFADLWAPLDGFVRAGHPVLATCAGMILSATGVANPTQKSFGWLDIDVVRNGWGRQVHSFETRDDNDIMDLVFIRAPRITRVGAEVEVIARHDGEAIAVRHANVTAASFHPELCGETALHRAAFAAV